MGGTKIHSLMDMSNRTTLITGAGGHLGYAMSSVLAEMKCNLILVDKNTENLDKTKSLLGEKSTVEIDTFCIDLEKQDDRQALLAEINKNYNDLSCLINNAAFAGDKKLNGWNTSFEEQSVETWRRALEVNLTSAFEISKCLVPLLNKSRNGNIINIASIYGELGPDWSLYENSSMGNPAAYAASKGALIQLTRWLATTLAPGIRVNAISPGGIFRNQTEEFVKKYSNRTPMGRMATEDDFLGITAFLASDMSSYVTGQIISVDGGWNAW